MLGRIKESRVYNFIRNVVSCLLVYGLIKSIYQMGLGTATTLDTVKDTRKEFPKSSPVWR